MHNVLVTYWKPKYMQVEAIFSLFKSSSKLIEYVELLVFFKKKLFWLFLSFQTEQVVQKARSSCGLSLVPV